MRFIVDKEAETVLNELLDMALKAGGIQNLEVVNHVKAVLVIHTEPMATDLDDPEKPEKSKKK